MTQKNVSMRWLNWLTEQCELVPVLEFTEANGSRNQEIDENGLEIDDGAVGGFTPCKPHSETVQRLLSSPSVSS
jgi:hypothetical protein